MFLKRPSDDLGAIVRVGILLVALAVSAVLLFNLFERALQ